MMELRVTEDIKIRIYLPFRISITYIINCYFVKLFFDFFTCRDSDFNYFIAVELSKTLLLTLL